MKRFLLLIFLVAFRPAMALAQDAQCPQPSGVDTDGTPLCPSLVAQTSAYAVYRCALEQFRTFHEPTKPEKSFMQDLLSSYQNKDTAALIKAAASLNLQVCRVKSSADDSYLLAYTKPGIQDYSGPFLMLRESAHSKVILISPHDDSDGTYADTKIALAKSKAMMVISNGHRRQNGDGKGDFVHDPCGLNLGCIAVRQVGALFPGHVWLHIHGMTNSKAVLYRGRNELFNTAYEKAIKANMPIDNLNPKFNADFSVDAEVNTNFYIKTEIPAKIHIDHQEALAGVVRDLEAAGWGK